MLPYELSKGPNFTFVVWMKFLLHGTTFCFQVIGLSVNQSIESSFYARVYEKKEETSM